MLTLEGVKHVMFVANEDIELGSELQYNYGFKEN